MMTALVPTLVVTLRPAAPVTYRSVTDLQPPVAERRPAERTHHGDTVVDDYSWLTNRDDPAVIAYLTGENAYTEAVMAPLAGLRETLFTEIRTRTLETDLSLPARRHG